MHDQWKLDVLLSYTCCSSPLIQFQVHVCESRLLKTAVSVNGLFHFYCLVNDLLVDTMDSKPRPHTQVNSESSYIFCTHYIRTQFHSGGTFWTSLLVVQRVPFLVV